MSDYVFSKHADDAERDRLRMLEAVHDTQTQRLLEAIGLKTGQSCAEVGAGAGSIARYMADVVGPAGRVTAIDLTPRFLIGAGLPQLEVRQGDITGLNPLEENAYDIVHARFVLLHLADPVAALRNLKRALKPDGVLLLEEPDFRTAFSAASDAQIRNGVDAVNSAISGMYRRMNLDPGFGLRLPSLLADEGLSEIEIHTTAPLTAGGSAMALMMRSSVAHLRDKLITLGSVTEGDIDAYGEAASDVSNWSSYYTTVSVAARNRPVTPGGSLEEVRAHIDRLDREIIALLGKRSGQVVQAAKFKTTAAEVSAPERVERVIAKIRSLAAEQGLPVEVAEATYRAMIGAFIDFESAVFKSNT